MTVIVCQAIVSPANTAQTDAAIMFAGAWGRAEMAAPNHQKPVWSAYRTCWTQSDARPFQGTGPELTSWKDPQPPVVVVSPADSSTTMIQPFTAEDLFNKCSATVKAAYPTDPSVPAVTQTILGLLHDRENDVQTWGDSSQTNVQNAHSHATTVELIQASGIS